MSADDHQLVALKANVIVQDSTGKILFVRRRSDENWMSGKLVLPSGLIKSGELIADGAVRELREETGLVRKDIVLVHVCDLLKPGIRYSDYFFKLAEPVNFNELKLVPEDGTSLELRYFHTLSPTETDPNLLSVMILIEQGKLSSSIIE